MFLMLHNLDHSQWNQYSFFAYSLIKFENLQIHLRNIQRWHSKHWTTSSHCPYPPNTDIGINDWYGSTVCPSWISALMLLPMTRHMFWLIYKHVVWDMKHEMQKWHEIELKYSAAWRLNVKYFTVTEIDWLTGNGVFFYNSTLIKIMDS